MIFEQFTLAGQLRSSIKNLHREGYHAVLGI